MLRDGGPGATSIACHENSGEYHGGTGDGKESGSSYYGNTTFNSSYKSDTTSGKDGTSPSSKRLRYTRIDQPDTAFLFMSGGGGGGYPYGGGICTDTKKEELCYYGTRSAFPGSCYTEKMYGTVGLTGQAKVNWASSRTLKAVLTKEGDSGTEEPDPPTPPDKPDPPVTPETPKHTLTVYPNGGSWSGSSPVTLEEGATQYISTPSRTGYTFSGWSLSGTGCSMTSLTSSATFTMGTSDATLTANWDAKRSKLRVYPNKGSWSGGGNWNGEGFYEFQSTYGSRQSIPIPTRTGYTFKGWTKSSSFYGSIDNTTGPGTYTFGSTEGITDTLTAQWEPYTAQITFTKRDCMTNEVLDGAIFGLYEWNGSTYVKMYDLDDNRDGTYSTKVMVYRDGQGGNEGKFKIKEEKAPKYYTNKGYEKEIALTEPGFHHYTSGFDMTNEPDKVKVRTVKVDSETGNRIEGAVFAIYEWNKYERKI